MMRYIHWFWDFDGTLYDSYPHIVQLTRGMLNSLGADAPEADILRCAKDSLSRVFQQYTPQADPDEVVRLYNQHSAAAGLDGMRPYPGAAQFLKASHALGARHYLYTHRDGGSLDMLMRDGLYDLFADYVTSLDGFPSKPAPDALNHLVEKHGLDRAVCVMVGDRAMDLDAGKSAGMATILLDPDGFYADYQPDHRFGDYASMHDALL